MSESIYYLNGQFLPAAQASLPLGDLGLVRGFGVFDLLRTYDGVPFKLRQHVKRLEHSADQIGLALPWATDQLVAFVEETYALNHAPEAAIRIIVTGGSSANFMMPENRPTLAIMVQPLAPYDAHLYAQGATVITTPIERLMPTVKSLNYIGAIMAMIEAEKVGAIEAIYRSEEGELTEATRSNIFIVRNGKLITPVDGVLVGITRQVVLELASDVIDVVEGPIYDADLADADEAFLTSTTKEILPVVEVDNQPIAGGFPGPMTQRLSQMFRTYTTAHQKNSAQSANVRTASGA